MQKLSVTPNATLRDVARAAQVGLATASRALRDDPLTKPATRERVKRAAELLGYRPDPGMAHLIERRWRGRRREGGMNIAYLYNGQGEASAMARTQYGNFAGVAERMGYVLLEVDMANFSSLPQLLRRLMAQGVEGLLVCVLPSVPYEIAAIFRKYPAVSMSVSHYRPSCPVIMHDEFTAITDVFNTLQTMGYQRPGVILSDHPDSVTSDLRLGAILTRITRLKPLSNRIPILYYPQGSKRFENVFQPWIKRFQPDVVIGYEDLIEENIEALGYRVPEDVAYATFNLWGPGRVDKVAGYFRDSNELCVQGLRLLNMMIRTGCPGTQKASLIEMVAGEWKDGKTLPILAPSDAGKVTEHPTARSRASRGIRRRGRVFSEGREDG